MNKSVQNKRKWKNYSWGEKIFLISVYVIVITLTLACLYPLYFTVIASLSDAYAVYTGKVTLLPVGFTLDAYSNVFKNKDIWMGYSNSIFYTVTGTLFNLILTIPTAYALSKNRMLGRGVLMTLFLITMYFGGGMIPTYLLYKNLNLLNTRLVLIIVGGISVYNIIVTRTYFQNNIPDSMYEAAKIDGANEFHIFFKMALPLSSPILAVMALYYAVGHWSSYFNALIYTNDKELQPLQIILRNILILNAEVYNRLLDGNVVSEEEMLEAAELAQQAQTMKFALVFIASAPLLIAYPFVQKHFVKGVMIGSIKG